MLLNELKWNGLANGDAFEWKKAEMKLNSECGMKNEVEMNSTSKKRIVEWAAKVRKSERMVISGWLNDLLKA